MSMPSTLPAPGASADPGSSNNKKRKRTLIIPQKRPLLRSSPASNSSSSTSSKATNTCTYKITSTPTSGTNNAPTIPFQIRRPAFSSLPHLQDYDQGHGQEQEEDEKEKKKDTSEKNRIEFNSSIAPQPFLEPETLEMVILRYRERQELEDKEEEDRREDEDDTATTAAADGEYGSMAIRNRMRVHGRGVGGFRDRSGGGRWRRRARR